MPELLAPCGNMSALKAAVYGGADAVYLGLKLFNARIKADNFTEENIGDVTKFCHLYGVKVYITLNTAIKNSEIVNLNASILACKKAGVDAFIISDLAVLEKIVELAPEIAIHISTQAGVCNLEGAKFFEKRGASRVVLARETELCDIIDIKTHTSLEIECFVHGALCVAFSGKCLFSAMVNGNSGNRGRCLQPCRLPYCEKSSGKEGYFLSTADLCLAENLKELHKIGVDSFKIEGRLRSEDYVYRVVSAYREIIDNGYKVSKDNLSTLNLAFNRGNFSHGYAFEKDDKAIMSTKVQGNVGQLVGYISRLVQKKNKNYSEISTNIEISKLNGFKLLDTKGLEVWGGKIPDFFYEKNKLYANIQNAKVGYELRMTQSNCEIIPKKIPVNVNVEICKGVLSLKLSSKNIATEYFHDKILDNAINQSLDDENLYKAFSKLGNTEFFVNEFNANFDGQYFASMSELNDIRRRAFDALENQIIENYKRINFAPIKGKNTKKDIKCLNLQEKSKKVIAIELQNVNQISKEVLNLTDILVYSPEEYSIESCMEFVVAAKNSNDNIEIYLKLLPNADASDVRLFRKILENSSRQIDGIFCDNFYAVELAEEYGLKAFGGLGLNIFNNIAVDSLGLNHFLASAELNLVEISKFNIMPFVFAHGFLPLMNLKYCPYKVILGSTCQKCTYNKEVSFVDRKNYNFKILRNKANKCYFTLYNSVICDISAKCQKTDLNYYINMLNYSSNQIEKILLAYRQELPLRLDNFTYGHLFRGVE